MALDGFKAATAPWTVGADCWQQLAVVKSGPQLTFYYNKAVAGGWVRWAWGAHEPLAAGLRMGGVRTAPAIG